MRGPTPFWGRARGETLKMISSAPRCAQGASAVFARPVFRSARPPAPALRLARRKPEPIQGGVTLRRGFATDRSIRLGVQREISG